MLSTENCSWDTNRFCYLVLCFVWLFVLIRKTKALVCFVYIFRHWKKKKKTQSLFLFVVAGVTEMRGISSRSLYSLSRSLLSRVSHVATSGGCSRETRALGSLWSALQSRGVKVNAIQVEFLLIWLAELLLLLVFLCSLWVVGCFFFQLRPGNVIERTGLAAFLLFCYISERLWIGLNLTQFWMERGLFQDVLSGLVIWTFVSSCFQSFLVLLRIDKHDCFFLFLL